MTDFETRLSNFRKQTETRGIKFETSMLGEKHLLPVWYRGCAATVFFPDGYTVKIKSENEVSMFGKIKQDIIHYSERKDKSVFSEFGHKYSDNDIRNALHSGTLSFSRIRWFQLHLYSPSGEEIDMTNEDDVPGGDLLAVLENIDSLREFKNIGKEKYKYIINKGA